MTDIAIIDTSIGTDNLGDEIIMDSVNEILYCLFPDAYIYRVPSHDYLTRRSLGAIRRSDLCFVGGTNIIASPGWRLHWYDPLFLKDAICLGVTWGAPDTAVTAGRRRLLGRVLTDRHVHSVRDTYTKRILDKFGIRSVQTTCPTMWNLTPGHCERIPRRKAPKALFTLTAYRSDPAADRRMIEILSANYRELYFFSQMRLDLRYLQGLNVGPVKVISPTVHGYNTILENEDIDVIGSRLHGGIRALQRMKRALIVAIDHRSVEIANDTGLPILLRSEIEKLGDWINSEVPTEIHLPREGIRKWCGQFGHHASSPDCQQPQGDFTDTMTVCS